MERSGIVCHIWLKSLLHILLDCFNLRPISVDFCLTFDLNYRDIILRPISVDFCLTFDWEIRKQKMFKERIEHEKKEKESDEKFRYRIINWYYDDVAINPDDTD